MIPFPVQMNNSGKFHVKTTTTWENIKLNLVKCATTFQILASFFCIHEWTSKETEPGKNDVILNIFASIIFMATGAASSDIVVHS